MIWTNIKTYFNYEVIYEAFNIQIDAFSYVNLLFNLTKNGQFWGLELQKRRLVKTNFSIYPSHHLMLVTTSPDLIMFSINTGVLTNVQFLKR